MYKYEYSLCQYGTSAFWLTGSWDESPHVIRDTRIKGRRENKNKDIIFFIFIF